MDVAPLAKGGIKGTLSYFTPHAVSVGDVIKVPLRAKKVFALVVAVRDIHAAKASIKSSSFSIKKAEDPVRFKLFTSSTIEAARQLADMYATDLGSILVSLVPKTILENPEKSGLKVGKEKTEDSETKEAEDEVLETPCARAKKCEVLAVQMSDDDRHAYYKSLVREVLARGSSIFFLVPTSHDIERLESELSKGVEKIVFTFSSAHTKIQIAKQWKAALQADRPIVIIATGSFLSIPREDIGIYVIESDLSSAYRLPARPYLDLRTAAEYLACAHGSTCLYGGPLLRIATIRRIQTGDIHEASPLSYRLLSSALCSIVSMKKSSEYPSYILHPKLIERVQHARDRNERVFLFNSRRGLSPVVVCKDCGEMVRCEECGAPVALHAARERSLMCHHCGARRGADYTCKGCGGWNLLPLGIGVEAIVEEVKKYAPEAHVLWLSSDAATTRTQAKKVVDEFYASGGSVLVGTELALPYLRKDIEHTAVVSIDPLFSLPDFLIHERIMNVLLAVRRSATHTVTFQTRMPEHPLFSFAAQGNLIDYVKAEIEERKDTGAPPFSIVITLTISGEANIITEEMKKIQELFYGIEGLEVSAFPTFIPAKGGNKSLTCMLTLNRKLWPHVHLVQILRTLPPYVRVIIDAENIM